MHRVMLFYTDEDIRYSVCKLIHCEDDKTVFGKRSKLLVESKAVNKLQTPSNTLHDLLHQIDVHCVSK